MAGAGWRDFVAGEVLTAANVQDYLQDQSVMSFASSAARGSAIASPTEGMVSYLRDSNLVEVHDGSAWKQFGATTGSVLQVRSTTFAGTVAASTLAGNFTTITGLNTTITPISTLSKILVIANVNGARSTSQARVGIQLMRNSTAVGVGDAAGSRRRIGSVSFVDNVAELTMTNVSAMFLDSPATTSQVTYGVQAWNGDTSGTQTIYINRTGTDTDESAIARAASTLTLIEVAG